MAGETSLQIIAAHQHSVPVNVEAIARDLGLPIYYSELDRSIQGKLSRRGATGFEIFVNKSVSPERQRFTIAHEIAHYVLHKDLINVEIVDVNMYQSMLSSEYEAQANRLAVDILMPRELVRQAYERNPHPNELARAFEVSVEAMEIRLRNLIDRTAASAEA